MRGMLGLLFDLVYAAYRAAYRTFRAVDLLLSVSYAASRYALGAVLGIPFVLIVESLTLDCCAWCLFSAPGGDADWATGGRGDELADQIAAVISLIRGARILSAFGVFVAGQTLVILTLFWMLRNLLTFKLHFVLGSDKVARRGHSYAPFDDATTEAGAADPDPLSF